MSGQLPVVGKERPILFSGEMVRAILEGRKTQTRRVCKPEHFNGSEMPSDHAMENAMRFGAKCPYGQVGDRLWVKETHCLDDKGHVYFRADDPEWKPFGGWKPSIFMRREYSRITLEIVSVRVERLQEITPSDAQQEGVCTSMGMNQGLENRFGLRPYVELAYASLWESINGAGSWDANPWVWVIEFKKLPEAGKS